MQSTAVPPPEPASKSRTKAKVRYLKRKKERRKQRKSQVVKPKHTDPDPIQAQVAAQSDTDSNSEHDENVEPKSPTNVERGDVPRKRRRVSEKEPEVPDVEQEGINEVDSLLQQQKHNQSASPPPAFPSFPLPVAPDAPSKSTLALLGLDKALLDAQIISPSRNVPLDSIDAERSPENENENESESRQLPVLSQKMKKRLRELGITEFFAGKFDLLLSLPSYGGYLPIQYKPRFCRFSFLHSVGYGLSTFPTMPPKMYVSPLLPEVGRPLLMSYPLWK